MASTKKTPAASKVEAPIDNRETFVSLQKNFADSDMPVEEKLKTLYELQAADSEIDKIIQLRGELPAEVSALEAEIATLKERSAAISAVSLSGSSRVHRKISVYSSPGSVRAFSSIRPLPFPCAARAFFTIIAFSAPSVNSPQPFPASSGKY